MNLIEKQEINLCTCTSGFNARSEGARVVTEASSLRADCSLDREEGSGKNAASGAGRVSRNHVMRFFDRTFCILTSARASRCENFIRNESNRAQKTNIETLYRVERVF